MHEIKFHKIKRNGMATVENHRPYFKKKMSLEYDNHSLFLRNVRRHNIHKINTPKVISLHFA